MLAGSERDLALACVLAGGDDYELCFTAPPAMRERIEAIALALGIAADADRRDHRRSGADDPRRARSRAAATAACVRPFRIAGHTPCPTHRARRRSGFSSRIRRISSRSGSAPGWRRKRQGRSARSSRCRSPGRCARTPATAAGSLTIAALTLIGVWAAQVTGRDLGAADHGSIVIDEIAAFLLVLFFAGGDALRDAIAFRRVPLLRHRQAAADPAVDAALKNGAGVMADDFLAAGYTLIVLAIGQRVFGS